MPTPICARWPTLVMAACTVAAYLSSGKLTYFHYTVVENFTAIALLYLAEPFLLFVKSKSLIFLKNSS